MKIIRGGITAPKGYEANGLACGIKNSGKLDLALIYSEVVATTAAVFTTNRFAAHHIALDKANLKNNQAQVILINSGNANCAVGKAGLSDARNSTYAVARRLGIAPGLVLMASTGIIGKRLPVERIKKTLPQLVNGKGKDKASLAARAIMTTDKKVKQIALELEIGGKKIKIAAMAKGAGMIAPNMATMLCFITTDANIETMALKKSLGLAVENSFNRINVDGDMSTNDSVILMANGLAENKKIRSLDNKDFFIFNKTLEYVCQYLAKQIILDAEGATKFIEIKIKGARIEDEAQKIARRIANSPLFKTAMFGEDPNWGRIIAAAGSSGEEINLEKLEIGFGKAVVFKHGCPVKSDYNRLKNILSEREIEVNIDLNQGQERGFVWTTDLSEEYVRINAKYE